MTSLLALTALVFTCVTTDLRARRIPNVVVFPGMLLGMALATVTGGGTGLMASVEGLGVATALLFLPFALGGVGAGDVKMMAAVGTFLGPGATLVGLGAGLVAGGIVVALHLARIGRLREKLRATRNMVWCAAAMRSVEPLRLSGGAPDAVALPYSVPLALGTATAVLIHGGCLA